MSRSYIDIQRIIGVQTKTDRNGVPYVSVILRESQSGGEITLRMNVNQAGIMGSKIVDAKREAVERLKEAGYNEWPPRFILPDYSRENERKTDGDHHR